MPFLGLGLHIGDTEGDAAVGIGGPIVDRVLLTENNLWINTEDGNKLGLEDEVLWSPSDISTEGWWDASDGSTITTSGSEVTLVTDKSGNSYDLSTTTSYASGPTIGTVSQNGLNVFEFAPTIPSYQVLENNSFAWNQSSSAIAFAMVFRCDDEAQTDQDFLISGTETLNPRIAARRSTSDNLQILTSSNSIQTSGGDVTEGQVYLVVLKFNSTNSFIRLDGTERATGNIGTPAFSSLNIGTNFNEDQTIEGFIGEVVAFSDLTKTEIIEGYLAHKWGIEGNLDSSHPYALSAPTI